MPFGFIELKIITSTEKNLEKSTDSKLDIRRFDRSELVYAEYYGPHTEIQERQLTTMLVYRSDHIPLEKALNEGFKPNWTIHDGTRDESPSPLNLFLHCDNSSGSGCVSCTYSLSMIKNYPSRQNYVYLVKATGGFKDVGVLTACEITVPGGIDAQDIIAFRRLLGAPLKKMDWGKLNLSFRSISDTKDYSTPLEASSTSYPNKFDPKESLYINENFLRRYPALVEYIIERYLEPYEMISSQEMQKIFAIPGVDWKAEVRCSSSPTLEAIKASVCKSFDDYLKYFPSNERAEAVYQAIDSAKNLDHIWYILESQYDLFANDAETRPAKIFSVPGIERQLSLPVSDN